MSEQNLWSVAFPTLDENQIGQFTRSTHAELKSFRDGETLFCEVPISFAAAALGGETKVPTLDGPASLRIPPGTQSGTTFRLRNRGMPVLNSKDRGDLMTRVVVEVPTKLNAEQREKLESFSASCGEHNSPQQHTFWDKAKEFFS